MSRFLSVLVLSILVASCGLFGSDDGPPKLQGEYRIQTINDGVTATFKLDLSESDVTVSGTGTLTLEDQSSSDAATYDVSVDGEHEHPDVMLEIETSEGEITQLDGTASDDARRVEGTLTFPSGLQKEVMMRKQ